MKRIISVILVLMLLMAVVPATSLAAAAVSNGETKVYHVNACGGTHLRKGAGTKYAVIGCLPNGTALVRKCKSGKWWKVKTMKGKVGWVESKYIRDNARANVCTPKSGLNVRSGPSKSCGILYSIPHGTKGITVYKTKCNWAYVKWCGHKKGWASLDYLKWTRW